MLKVSDSLVLGYDVSENDEVKLIITRHTGKKLELINLLTGEKAKEIYNTLIK